MAKKRKKKKKSRFSKRKIFLTLLLAGIVSIFMAALFVLAIYLGAFGKLPDAEEITGIKQDNASLVYAADGALMGKYYQINPTHGCGDLLWQCCLSETQYDRISFHFEGGVSHWY